MLPQIALDGSRPVDVPPPPHFHGLTGPLRHVRWKSSGATAGQGMTAAQKAGLRYEAKAQDYLSRTLGRAYNIAPFLHFDDHYVARTAVPDGIYFGLGANAFIFEIKISHTPDAWWQLRKLYQPVVEELDFVRSVTVIEVVKSLDPSVPFPEETYQIRGVEGLIPSPRFNVFIWRP